MKKTAIVVLLAAAAALRSAPLFAQSAQPNYAVWSTMTSSAGDQAHLRVQARDSAGKFIAAATAEGTIETGRFYIAGGIWEGGAGVLTGILVDAAGQRHVELQQKVSASPRGHAFTRIGAGAAMTSPDPDYFFNGQIAEVLVFNRLLNADQQQRIETYLTRKHLSPDGQAEHFSIHEGLVLHLDAAKVQVTDGRVTRWPDQSGRGNDARPGAAPSLARAATPAGGDAVDFDGHCCLDIAAKPAEFDGENRSWYVVFNTRAADSGRIINSGYQQFSTPQQQDFLLQRLKYNHPGLLVNLAVGLSSRPLPMDHDGDGRDDLVIASAGTDYRGTYLFQRAEAPPGTMLFKAGKWIDDQIGEDAQLVDGKWILIGAGHYIRNYATSGRTQSTPLTYQPDVQNASDLRLVDCDGDGVLDLMMTSSTWDWQIYGWDCDYDSQGNWLNPSGTAAIHWVKNTGSNEQPKFAQSQVIQHTGNWLEQTDTKINATVVGDFNEDGLFDILCTDGLDGFRFLPNVGSKTEPRFGDAVPLHSRGEPIRVPVQAVSAAAADLDHDGHLDLLAGEESGAIYLIRNSGIVVDGIPQFEPIIPLQQEANELKTGSLVTPEAHDLDGDGDEDLICGNSGGFIVYFENLGGDPPRWAAPRFLESDHRIMRMMPGRSNSVQGPKEAKWGYTNVAVADWDQDDLPDLIVNSSLGRVRLFRNLGPRREPKFAAPEPILVEWEGATPKMPWDWWTPIEGELVAQWRSRVQVIDLTGDGLLDIAAMDVDGYLVLYERKMIDGQLKLLPGRRVFELDPGSETVFDHMQRPVGIDADADGISDLNQLDAQGRLHFAYMIPRGERTMTFEKFADRSNDPRYAEPLSPHAYRMNGKWGGGSGRRKFSFTDWDGDGKIDLIVNAFNADFLKNISDTPGKFVFKNMGRVDERRLAGHTTCPSVVDFDRNGIPDLIIGAENGFIYYMKNPRVK
ncbi:MAG: VCBS repeat-containing protein [Phycisphaeraceae bacterium]|nr:VCBS repeat-containing protein [Phycisphaeraceae bacterium]